MKRTGAVLATSVVAAIGVCGTFLAPGVDRLPGSEPGLLRDVEEGELKSRQLDAELVEVKQELEQRHALADDLIAGQTTLSRSADAHLALNESRPGHLATLRSIYPRCTDRECAARQAVAFTRNRPGGPAIQESVARRLAAEFEAMFPGSEPLFP